MADKDKTTSKKADAKGEADPPKPTIAKAPAPPIESEPTVPVPLDKLNALLAMSDRLKALEDDKAKEAERQKLIAERQAEDAKKAADTTPPKVLGSITITDRTTPDEVFRRVRELRAGNIPGDLAKRFRTAARIYPDPGTALAKKYPGQTIPLGAEVDRGDFTPASLKHHLETQSLIAIE